MPDYTKNKEDLQCTFDIDSLNDPIIGAMMDVINEGNVTLIEASREEIPEEVLNQEQEQEQEQGHSQEHSQTQSQEQSQSQNEQSQEQTSEKASKTLHYDDSEMTNSLRYIRENMMKNRSLTQKFNKNLYIDKKDVARINDKFFEDKAELMKNGKMDEKDANAEAWKRRNKALDNLCKNAKPFDEKSFREMQLMAGKRSGSSESFDVIHFSKGEDGKPKISEVRVSGHSMTAKQLKQIEENKAKSTKHNDSAHHSMHGIKGGVKSFLGGDAQSQVMACISISADLVLVALQKMLKLRNDAKVAAIERKVKKSIDMGETDIDLDEILKQVEKDFSQTQEQTNQATQNVSQDVKDDYEESDTKSEENKDSQENAPEKKDSNEKEEPSDESSKEADKPAIDQGEGYENEEGVENPSEQSDKANNDEFENEFGDEFEDEFEDEGVENPLEGSEEALENPLEQSEANSEPSFEESEQETVSGLLEENEPTKEEASKGEEDIFSEVANENDKDDKNKNDKEDKEDKEDKDDKEESIDDIKLDIDRENSASNEEVSSKESISDIGLGNDDPDKDDLEKLLG